MFIAIPAITLVASMNPSSILPQPLPRIPDMARRPVVSYLPMPNELKYLVDRFLMQMHPVAEAFMSEVSIEEVDMVDIIEAGNVNLRADLSRLKFRVLKYRSGGGPWRFHLKHPLLQDWTVSRSGEGPWRFHLKHPLLQDWTVSRSYFDGENCWTRRIQKKREEFYAQLYRAERGIEE